MANFKKTAALVSSYVLVGALAIGGTMANFNYDDESKYNTFTVGDAVDIVINEYQRNEDGTALEDFEQGKAMYPIVGSAQGKKDDWGLPDTSEVKNYVDKVVTVENVGQVDADVRVYVGMPKALSDLYGTSDESDNALHMNLGNRIDFSHQGTYSDPASDEWKSVWNWKYTEAVSFDATVDGVEYSVTCYTMNGALAKDTESMAILAGAYLDEGVDYDDGVYTMYDETYGEAVINYDFSKGVHIPVYAEAIAAGTEFTTTPEEAFNAYFADEKLPVLVESAADLAKALENGGDVVLTADITVEETLEVKAGTSATIDLNGNNITAVEANAETGRSIYAIDNYGELTLTGEGTIEARGIENFGIMTIDSDDITIVARDGNGGAAIWNEGKLTINAGTFTTNTIDDGEMSDPGALNNQSSGTVVINGGTFDANGALCYAIINSGDMTINDATVTARHGAVANSDGTTTIYGGNFTCEGVENQSDHCVYASGGTVTINGGTYTHKREGQNGSAVFFDNGGTLVDTRNS